MILLSVGNDAFCLSMPYSNSCNKCDDSTCFPGHNSPKASDAPDTWECSNDRFTGIFVKSNEAGIGLNNSAQIPDVCYFLRKWWTWQSFNKAILLSFPSPERDKECILQQVPGVNRFRDSSTEKTSRWREVSFRSSWAPNEDTHYLSFQLGQRSPQQKKLSRLGTVSNWPNNMCVGVSVCVCVCVFLFFGMFFWRRGFFANFFQDCYIHLLRGKTWEKQLTPWWLDSGQVHPTRNAHTPQTSLSRNNLSSQTEQRCGFTSRVNNPSLGLKKQEGTKHVDLNYIFKSKSLVSGFCSQSHIPKNSNASLSPNPYQYTAQKKLTCFSIIFGCYIACHLSHDIQQTSNSQSSATLGVSLIGICAKGQIQPEIFGSRQPLLTSSNLCRPESWKISLLVFL